MTIKKCKDQKCYEEVIKDLYFQVKESDEPDPVTYKALKDRVKSWYEFLDIRIQVPMNEKKPWITHEIGFLTEKMPLKSESGYDQTGDYAIHIVAEGIDCIGGLLAERKSLQDLDGTIGQEDNFRRFHREISRFHKDDRYEQMIIFVEGTFKDFLNLDIPRIAYRMKEKRANDAGKEYEPKSYAERVEARHRTMKAKLASIQTKGVGIHWGENRQAAAAYYGDCVRHWILNNYDAILEIDN